MAEDTQINVVAAIRPLSDDTPACVVRWVLGTKHELPHTDDVFDVILTVVENDGTTRRQQIATTSVKPLEYFMLDTARTLHPIGLSDGTTVEWGVTTVPTGPVDPRDADNWDLRGKAFGVCHLLAETESSRVQWRAASILARSMAERPPAEPLLASDIVRLHAAARSFAQNLWRSQIRPRDLPTHLRRYIAALRDNLQMGTGVFEGDAGLFTEEDVSTQEHFVNMARVVHALGDRATLEALDKRVTQATQVREHLRLRTLHGGELLNYWYDPEGSGGGTIADRGARLPAAEVIGCGCTIPISAETIADCVNNKRQIIVEVTQRPRDATHRTDEPLTSLDQGGPPGNIIANGDRGGFQPGSWLITWFMLNDAQQHGHSIAIPAPKKAFVNFSMIDNDAASSKPDIRSHGSGISFATGDGRVEIVIIPPDQPKKKTTVAAYNVYGIWEGAPGANQFFADPPEEATLAALQPWRMTRRYSFHRDLKPAFPAEGGALHPVIPELLSDPPWQPLLRQPDVIQSENTDTPDPLPRVGAAGEGRFAVDLRRGMQLNSGEIGGVPLAWDLALPADTTWTPDRDRDGQLFNPAAHRPQRYRFWVTSVDAFEQESNPVPVETNDGEAGEEPSYFFEPRRRTPIPGPPSDDAVALSYDDVAGTLAVTFETPPEADIAGTTNPAEPGTKRVDARKLTATVALFRRRLLTVRDAASTSELAFETGDDLPQWQRVVRDLTGKGWRRFGSPITVNAPANGDTWKCVIPLTPSQRGWEYVAAISFSVTREFESFWCPNVIKGRSVLVAEHNGSSVDYKRDFTTETPRASDVTLTHKLALINNAPPRSAVLDAQNTAVLWAKPVPAPPGVRRDLVLLRLLTQDFKPRPAEGWPDWRDTGIKMTPGQAAMCDTALSRTNESRRIPFDPGDASLKTTRQILADGFQTLELQRVPLRQHATLGFRGILDLHWVYHPLEVQPSPRGPLESEATKFRIYSVRAPEDPGAAEPFATVSGNGRLSAPEIYEMTLTKGAGAAFETISTHAMPTLACVRAGGTADPIWTQLIVASQNGAVWVQVAAPPGTTLPDTAKIDLFAAQPLADVSPTDLDQEQSLRVLLPIGGGHAETIAWWIVSVSAKGLETAGASAPMYMHYFPPTIEPSAPQAITVRNARAADQDFLDPAQPQYRAWLPSDIRSLDDATYFPRLVVGWAPPDDTSSTYVAFERDERHVAGNGSPPLSLDVSRAWRAIKAIEGADETEALKTDDLAAIRNTWLLGNLVEPGNDKVTPHWFIEPNSNKRLRVADGLIRVQTDEPATRPGFIDYFGRNGDPASVMDSNWEFRYRATSFVDLDARLPEEWRYLFSAPSAWSEWRLPETPPLTTTPGKPSFETVGGQYSPLVRFRLTPKPPAALLRLGLLAAMPEHQWEYRVLIRRKITIPMPSSGGSTGPVWIDVGQPKRFLHTPTEVVDAEVDRDWGRDEPVLHYRVFVQQFLVLDGGEERLVRGFSGTPGSGYLEMDFTLPAPASSEGEIVYSQEVIVS